MLKSIFNQVKNYLPFLILGIYSVLAFIFAYERILNVDNSNFFFHIVDEQVFFTPENRFGVFISQIPLILLAKLQFSLKILLYTYSITFPIFYAIIAAICFWILRVKEAALCIALILITGIAFGFFHPVTETYHALVYAIFLYAILVSPSFKQVNPFLYYLAIITTCSLSIISHPIAVFATGFVVVFTFFNKNTNYKTLITVFILAGFSLTYRILTSNTQSYDGQQYKNMFENMGQLFSSNSCYPVIYISNRIDSVYLGFVILFVWFIVLSIANKKSWILIYSLVSSFLFSVLTIITFLNGDADMMMEKSFMPAIFMIILPFSMLYFHSNLKLQNITLLVLLVTVFLSFRQIVFKASYFTNRLQKIEHILITQNYPKTMANFSDLNEPILELNNWNTGIDSYILADCKLNKKATLFLYGDINKLEINNNDSTLFLGPSWWYKWDTKNFKSNYFTLPQVPYKKYKTNQ